MRKIKIGICGYGNIGKGVELAISQNPDMELVRIFTRRNTNDIIPVSRVPVIPYEDISRYSNAIDVMVVCGGSAKDLPEQSPFLAGHFNIVDSFDTHNKLMQHFSEIDKQALANEKVAIISTGWDPGDFSVQRVNMNSALPAGSTYTFWGPGVSQGHSDAIRQIEGVKDARQYTVPKDIALNCIRGGKTPVLTEREKYFRECYVVAEDGADQSAIENSIKTMEDYFADYDTKVFFISERDMKERHSKMPHGGFVYHIGTTGDGNKHIIEYKLQLDSNPEYTGSVMLSYARAAYRMNRNGEKGAKTVLDVSPAMRSIMTREELLKSGWI